MMERDAELALNEVGNALGSPQLVGPTVGLGAFTEHLLQLLLLREGQARCGARVGLGSEAIRLLGQLEPAIDGTWVDADNASDILYFVALCDGLHSLASPLFQSAGRSIRSAHTPLYARVCAKGAIGGAAVSR